MSADIHACSGLRAEFSEVYLAGLDRTKMDKRGIEFFLPLSLRNAFQEARASKVLADNPTNRDLVKFLRDDLFGKLPAFDAPITPQDAVGVRINGELCRIYMNRVIGRIQLQRELLGLDLGDVIDAAYRRARSGYSRNQVSMVVTSGGGTRLDRQLAGHVVNAARQMKQEPI